MLLRASNEMFVVPRPYDRLGNQMVSNAACASAGVRHNSCGGTSSHQLDLCGLITER